MIMCAYGKDRFKQSSFAVIDLHHHTPQTVSG
jgi:hypothetical protein